MKDVNISEAGLSGWQYYNNAAIPVCAPHEKAELAPIRSGSIWKMKEKPLLARWTTDYDCGYETEWWYTVLDTPCRLENLKSDRRYKINKGLKNYRCMAINPADYAHGMAIVTYTDFQTYPKKYRPDVTVEQLENSYINSRLKTWGAINENNELCAFCSFAEHESFYELQQNKSLPAEQKNQVNAALIYTALTDLTEEIEKGKYISNGQRNVYHETSFNEYLCKYFGFRKAFCRLGIAINPKYKAIVRILFVFRKLLTGLDNISIVHKINAVLKMVEISKLYQTGHED